MSPPSVRDTTDLQELLDRDVYPRLFDCLDSAFPEFGWQRRGDHWEASSWPPGFPYSVNDKRPDRLCVYPDRPHWIKLHGHSGVRWLEYLAGQSSPRGQIFTDAARELFRLAGVSYPERSLTPEQIAAGQERDRRRDFLDAMLSLAAESIWTDKGDRARSYLHERGIDDQVIRDYRLGIIRSKTPEILDHLTATGWDRNDAEQRLRPWRSLRGYILIPWQDEMGRPLTVYGRWPGKPPLMKDHPDWRHKREQRYHEWEQGDRAEPWKEPSLPKTFALPGKDSKGSPLYLDRARRAGHREIVLVEGVLDALVLQAKGDTRVVASVAAQLSGEQVRTLQRCRIDRVLICGDPDGGGDQGNANNVRALANAEITPFVVPRLPDGMDPDEFVIAKGIDAWREWTGNAQHGYRFLATTLLDLHGPREVGDDLWCEHLLDRAIPEARTLPGPDALERYYLPVIAEAVGCSVASLMTRIAGATPPTPMPNGTGQPVAVEERRSILIGNDEHRVNDEAIEAVAADLEVYVRGSSLVRVVRAPESTQSRRGLNLTPGTPSIGLLPSAILRETLTRHVVFVKETSGGKIVPVTPPSWCIDAIQERGFWPGLRQLANVIEAPTLRADGSILDVPGYDHDSGLLYVPNGEFPPMLHNPTIADARRAVNDLLVLVEEFEFAAEVHRYVWLAALLTALVRDAIPGPTPLTLIEASTPGSGKSLLVHAIGSIATGRDPATSTLSDNPDETRKVILSIALAGTRIVWLDNSADSFGDRMLDAALTSVTWQDRVLGRSEMSAPLPLNVCWLATGNNLRIKGDTHRRILPCRLVPSVERPEEKGNYKIADLKAYAREHRSRLVIAGLTIVRAFAVAGMPQAPLTHFGSFEAWSRLIRQSIYWATGVDVCQAREDIPTESRGDTDMLGSFLPLLAQLPNGGDQPGLTSSEIKRLCAAPGSLSAHDPHAQLRQLLLEWIGRKEEIDAKILGKRLSMNRDRVVGNYRLCRSNHRCGIAAWYAKKLDGGGSGGSGGSVLPPYAGESCHLMRNRMETLPPHPPLPPESLPDDWEPPWDGKPEQE